RLSDWGGRWFEPVARFFSSAPWLCAIIKLRVRYCVPGTFSVFVCGRANQGKNLRTRYET
ncbi:MAG TPA: hypothetical protein PKJ30_18410, partial [Leptospiraceae bacterium]|nr:hypothetical protein [Leptospiraceae bacterium]